MIGSKDLTIPRISWRNGTLPREQHQAQVSAGMPLLGWQRDQEGQGRDIQRKQEIKVVFFWQRRGGALAELSLSLKTCRRRITQGAEERRRGAETQEAVYGRRSTPTPSKTTSCES